MKPGPLKATLRLGIGMLHFFFFSSRRRHTRCSRDWSSDVCSSDLQQQSPTKHTRILRRNPSHFLSPFVLKAISFPATTLRKAFERPTRTTRSNAPLPIAVISFAPSATERNRMRDHAGSADARTPGRAGTPNPLISVPSAGFQCWAAEGRVLEAAQKGTSQDYVTGVYLPAKFLVPLR